MSLDVIDSRMEVNAGLPQAFEEIFLNYITWVFRLHGSDVGLTTHVSCKTMDRSC